MALALENAQRRVPGVTGVVTVKVATWLVTAPKAFVITAK
jgi:hypothetical protein